MTGLSPLSPTRTFNHEPTHINSSHRVLRHILFSIVRTVKRASQSSRFFTHRLPPLRIDGDLDHNSAKLTGTDTTQSSLFRVIAFILSTVSDVSSLDISCGRNFAPLPCWHCNSLGSRSGLVVHLRVFLWCLAAFSVAWATHGLPFIDGAGVPWWRHQRADPAWLVLSWSSTSSWS